MTDLVDAGLEAIDAFEDLGDVMTKDAAEGVGVFGLAIVKNLPFTGALYDALLDITGAAKDASRSLTDMYQNSPNPDRRDGRGLPTGTSSAGVIQAIRDYERRNGIQIL